jgi:hypothetical protein
MHVFTIRAFHLKFEIIKYSFEFIYQTIFHNYSKVIPFGGLSIASPISSENMMSGCSPVFAPVTPEPPIEYYALLIDATCSYPVSTISIVSSVCGMVTASIF